MLSSGCFFCLIAAVTPCVGTIGMKGITLLVGCRNDVLILILAELHPTSCRLFT